ncbi:DUF4388 domain-containing protein [candidate division CSSED10-310 bacterium]|uniref:DUF4388 domain-containing protein n=1 Tax=candidate division CSSED10-310 bacterium TaxID=2855610 RepID=A0ABV6Z2K9_UNCC1
MKKFDILFVDPAQKDILAFLSALMGEWNSIKLVSSSEKALETIIDSPPDLIIAENNLPDTSGFELFKTIRTLTEYNAIPFVFLSAAISDTLRAECVNMGLVSFIEKSIAVEQFVNIIQSLLRHKEDQAAELLSSEAFSGNLLQMNFVELIQSMDMNQKTGKLILKKEDDVAVIFFEKGTIVDAEIRNLVGEKAVYRLLSWSKGTFAFYNALQSVQQRVILKPQALIMEGLRRLDEKNRILEKLPDFRSILRSCSDVKAKLKPHEAVILTQFRHNSSLGDIIQNNRWGDLETIAAVQNLMTQNLIFPYLLVDKQSGAKKVVEPEALKKMVKPPPKSAESMKEAGKKIKTSNGYFGNLEEMFDLEQNNDTNTD